MSPTRAIAAGVLVAAALSGCGAKPGPESSSQAAPASVAIAKAMTVDRRRSASFAGTVHADHAATIMARVGGSIARIDATPGQAVAAGDALVQLQADELRARRDQARAILVQAEADLTRARQLVGQQVVTKAELDAAQSRADASTSALAEAEALLGYTRIAAPFSGVVVHRHQDPGATVLPGTPLLDLEDPTTLRLEVEVPESVAAGIAVGARAAVSIEAAGYQGEQPVIEVTPAADPATRTVLVKITLPSSSACRSGQFGRAGFSADSQPELVVPVSSVIHRGQLDAVLVVDGGIARLRLVRLGDIEAGQAVVRAGLADGEMVVTAPPADLADGARVVAR